MMRQLVMTSEAFHFEWYVCNDYWFDVCDICCEWMIAFTGMTSAAFVENFEKKQKKYRVKPVPVILTMGIELLLTLLISYG